MTIPNIGLWSARKGIGLVATERLDSPIMDSGNSGEFGRNRKWIIKTQR